VPKRYMSIEQAYGQRLKEKDSDFLFVELAEARRAGSHLAIDLLVAELTSRGLRVDQPYDAGREG
jgi:hypothetical protein